MHVDNYVTWQQTSYISVLLFDADGTENTFPSVVASIPVYRAVAWQCVDQIRYIIIIISVLTLVVCGRVCAALRVFYADVALV
jgi:hypothetical protein